VLLRHWPAHPQTTPWGIVLAVGHPQPLEQVHWQSVLSSSRMNQVMRRGPPPVERYGYLIAAASVVAATVVFYPGRAHFAKGQWALLYLLIVGLVASLSGVGPAGAGGLAGNHQRVRHQRRRLL